MKKSKVLFILSAAAVISLSSCSSLQKDVVITTIPSAEKAEVSNYEYRLVYLDAQYSFNIKDYYSPSEQKEKDNACNALLRDIKNSLNKSNLVNATRARLKALEGRIYLIQGDKTKATASFKESSTLYSGDIQQIILGHRLKIYDQLAETGFSNFDKPVILVEEALDFYNDKKYPESVAKFDEAFISAESFYYDAYKALRDEAWEFRSVSEEDSLSAYLTIRQLNLEQMILITKEYPAIIGFYIDSAKINDSVVFRKLTQKGVFTAATKDKPPAKLYPNTVLTRKLQARCLWNIYCDLKSKHKIKTRYSELYTSSKRTSPIGDVKIDDEDFDAIIGCIEFNLMNLTDGVNFNPDDSVSGIDFNESLKKLNSKL